MRYQGNFSIWALALVSLTLCAPAGAHPVTVDGSATDWFANQPPYANLGEIFRNGSGQGEYVWRDVTGDYRTDLGPLPWVDLTEFRVTGTTSSLFFLIRTAGTSPPVLSKPSFQIAVDRGPLPGSQPFLAGFSDTQVAPDAAWEYLIQTRYGQSGIEAVILDRFFQQVSIATIAAAVDGSCFEISVPWSVFGYPAPIAAPSLATERLPMRFTVASFVQANESGDTQDVGGPSVSNALDVVSNEGDPRAMAPYASTWEEVMDGDVDYHPDVLFALGLEVSGFLINEALVQPSSGPEYVEILGSNALDGFRIGDEETLDPPINIEFMGRMNGSGFGASGIAVVAQSATAFQAQYGFLPAYEIQDTDPTVPNVTADPLWSPGVTFTLANAGDEVLLLDANHTILDVLPYGTGSWLGTETVAVPPAGLVLRRQTSGMDTNRASDFIVDTPHPSVGVAPQQPSGIWCSAPTPNPATQGVELRFGIDRSELARVEVLDVVGRRVAIVFDRLLAAGHHSVGWDLSDGAGKRVPSGLYFFRLTVGDRAVLSKAFIRL